jgi:hypothetical protein
MNRIDYQAQYLGNIRDPSYAEASAGRQDRKRSNVEGKKFTEVPEFRDDVKKVEDRVSTRAFHRLHARTGFDLPGQNPRRRHEMEDQGHIR